MTKDKLFTPCPNKDCIDLLEFIHYHMEEYYGKNLSSEEVKEVFWFMTDRSSLSEMIYEVAMEYAEEQGWEMII